MHVINSLEGSKHINDLPSFCPFCHNSITPNLLYGHVKNSMQLEVFMKCPNNKCNASFLAYYQSKAPNENSYYFTDKLSKGEIVTRKFKPVIKEISKSFVDIYIQASFAEQNNLSEICGVGYRKALEFLIKDYIITKRPKEEEKIKKKFLSACIEEYVEDERIKKVSKRAVWLGNDETHYVKKWEGKNLTDLKNLIDLTIHWIEMEKLTEKFEEDMPEGKK